MKAKILLLTGLAFAGLGHGGSLAAQYEFQSKFGSFGSAPGQFDDPRGVAVNSGGEIIIAESGNNRVQVCSDQGACTAFGSFGVESGQFDRPRGVAVNSEDRLLIADRGNDRIQNCNSSGVCTAFGGTGSAVGQFESPRGVAVTADDRIVVADTDNNRIQLCTDQGACTAFGTSGAGLGQFNSPAGVAVNGAGQLIIADRGNNRIQICSQQGSCSAFGTTGSGLGQFDSPAGVAVDSQNRIVVVDRFNDRVQICSAVGSCTAFGTTGSGNGQFDLPWGVAVDASDRIIVADLGNNRIQIFAKAAPPVSIDSFTAVPAEIFEGESVTLTWSVSHATSCDAQNGTVAWSSLVPDPEGGNVDIQLDVAGQYTFTLSCTDGENTVVQHRQVVVQVAPGFLINAGLNDAWFYPATAGQGFFVTVFPDIGQIFVAWFTYEIERPDESVTAMLGEPGHRWITAFGPYSGDTAELAIEVTSGGVFDSPEHPVTQVNDGTLTLRFSGCNAGTVTYDIPSLGLSGEIPIQRIALDNVAFCETLAGQ
jgi:DNA-binding beta-propeller fold protein YncE